VKTALLRRHGRRIIEAVTVTVVLAIFPYLVHAMFPGTITDPSLRLTPLFFNTRTLSHSEFRLALGPAARAVDSHRETWKPSVDSVSADVVERSRFLVREREVFDRVSNVYGFPFVWLERSCMDAASLQREGVAAADPGVSSRLSPTMPRTRPPIVHRIGWLGLLSSVFAWLTFLYLLRLGIAKLRISCHSTLTCQGCSYNLSGLPEGKTCPECGHARAS
jgi:hypothetical protein